MEHMHLYERIRYVRLRELPADEQAPFLAWLYGHTVPAIPDEEPTAVAYAADYADWLSDTRYGKPALPGTPKPGDASALPVERKRV